MSQQACSKQCLIGPAITKLSAGDLSAGYLVDNLSSRLGHIPGTQMHFKQNIVKSTKTAQWETL